METVKLKIDLSAMIFEFEGPSDFAQEVLTQFLEAEPRVSFKSTAEPRADSNAKDEHSQDAEDSADEEAGPNKAPAKQGKKKATAKPESYTILPDLDLVGKGQGRETLKQLYSEKGGSTLNNYEASTVFVHYLTRVMTEKEVGLNHLYSCYKHVGIRVPGSLRQLMYDQKKRGHFINITKMDDLKLTVNGENLVDHDLPKTEKAPK